MLVDCSENQLDLYDKHSSLVVQMDSTTSFGHSTQAHQGLLLFGYLVPLYLVLLYYNLSLLRQYDSPPHYLLASLTVTIALETLS